MKHLLSKKIDKVNEDVKGNFCFLCWTDCWGTCMRQCRYGCGGCFGNCSGGCASFCGRINW